jgi:hypothetical protein
MGKYLMSKVHYYRPLSRKHVQRNMSSNCKLSVGFCIAQESTIGAFEHYCRWPPGTGKAKGEKRVQEGQTFS